MNRPCIQRTVFQNYGSGDESYGYRMYDNHGQTYCNVMDKNDLALPDREFLLKAKKTFDEVADGLFDFALGNGIYVDDIWYDFAYLERMVGN